MTELSQEDMIKLQYAVLGHAGLGWTEIRNLKEHKNSFVDNEADFVKQVKAWASDNVYVGINPRQSKSGSGYGGHGSAKDIAYVTAMVFDLDPIRPKDTASSESQHEIAIAEADKLAAELSGVLADSGSGAHVYLPVAPIKVIDINGCATALKSFFDPIQKRFSNTAIRVDSTFDLPRVIRCWGTHNNKSNRPCRYLSGGTSRQNIVLDQSPVSDTSNGTWKANSNFDEQRFKTVLQTVKPVSDIFYGKKSFISRSECDFALGKSLFLAGFDRGAVKLFLRRNPNGKAKDRSESWLDQEVERIYLRTKQAAETSPINHDPADYIKDLDARKPGIKTGFSRWDSMTAGLKPGRFYIEAGRPTDGKTTRLVQMAINVATDGHSVLYFPTEVPRNSIIDKAVSAASGVPLRNFQYGDFTGEEKGRVLQAYDKIKKLPLIIAEDFSLTLEKVSEITRRVSPEVLIVDFLQYMKYSDPNSASELARNVAGIKKIGEERNIPVILASQLHRKPQGVADSLSDLKGTGSLEELGDVVTFIRTVDAEPYPAKSMLTIRKNKYGEPGNVPLDFHRAVCRFTETDGL